MTSSFRCSHIFGYVLHIFVFSMFMTSFFRCSHVFCLFFTKHVYPKCNQKISDVRHFPDERVLIRTAKDYKDYTGGGNTYAQLENDSIIDQAKYIGDVEQYWSNVRECVNFENSDIGKELSIVSEQTKTRLSQAMNNIKLDDKAPTVAVVASGGFSLVN